MNYMSNIQLLSNEEYCALVPSDYILNVKQINFKLVEFQLSKKTPTDTRSVLAYNTERFAQSHPDYIKAKLTYVDDTENGRCDLVAIIPNDVEASNILGPIMDRMIKRTKDMTNKISQEVEVSA